MAAIERRYLPPLNPGTSIAETDRERVYDVIRRHLADILTGDRSYYPDGVQKDLRKRADDLDGFVQSLSDLQGSVNDPANILGDAAGSLKSYADDFRKRIERAEPVDSIVIPPENAPTTRDLNELYLEPNPIAPPMQSLPRPRQERTISFGAERPEMRVAPPIFFPF